MIVLVDLEWLENTKHEVTPTQLSAIRTDESWAPSARFNTLFRPRDESFFQWKHIAYTGAAPKDYLSAPSAYTALEHFCAWLSPDDTLLWWSAESLQVFRKMLKIILKKDLTQKNYAVQTAFGNGIADGKKTRGGLYLLAKVRNLPTPSPQHRASNDVQVLLSLLRAVHFPLTLVTDPASAILPAKKAAPPPTFLFLVDPDARLAHHQKDCPSISPWSNLIGCNRIEVPIHYQATPCPLCCKAVWTQQLAKRNNDILSRSQCRYFFLPHGHSFHLGTCHFVQRAVVFPHGTIYYDSCIKNGKVPCKLCRPDLDDDPRRYGRPLQPPKAELTRKASSNGRACQSITAAEERALKRYHQARKERSALNLSSMEPQARADAITLTATRYAFWSSLGYSNFHLRNCRKLQHMTQLRGYARYSDAIRAGLQPCRICKPTAKHDIIVSVPIYNRERKDESIEELMALCASKGLRCTMKDSLLIIETGKGYWRVDPHQRPFFIEHLHTDETAYPDAQMHWQPRMFLSLQDVISYIEKHDRTPAESASDPSAP